MDLNPALDSWGESGSSALWRRAKSVLCCHLVEGGVHQPEPCHSSLCDITDPRVTSSPFLLGLGPAPCGGWSRASDDITVPQIWSHCTGESASASLSPSLPTSAHTGKPSGTIFTATCHSSAANPVSTLRSDRHKSTNIQLSHIYLLIVQVLSVPSRGCFCLPVVITNVIIVLYY